MIKNETIPLLKKEVEDLDLDLHDDIGSIGNAVNTIKDETIPLLKEEVEELSERVTASENGECCVALRNAMCYGAQPQIYDGNAAVDIQDSLCGNLYYILVEVDDQLISFGVHMLVHDTLVYGKTKEVQIWNVRGDGSGYRIYERLKYGWHPDGILGFSYAYVDNKTNGFSRKSATVHLYPIRTADSYI